MGTKVTMADIAHTLGVSTVTVSRALAGKDGVGDAMREDILRLAADMGYQSKPPAKLQPEGETVGILISCRFIGKGQSFYWSMYERVLERLSEYDAFGILEPLKEEDESRGELPRLVRNGRVQSLLVIGHLEQRCQQALMTTGLPMVQIDEYTAGSSLDSVISDGYYGMYAITDYILRRGHRRLAYVGSVGATSSITDRYFGYCRAMQEWGLPVRQDWVLPDRKGGEVFDVPIPEDLPSAFACSSDWVAQRLIQQLNQRGVRVPEDVSVVGFDGFAPSPLSPELTTYAVDMEGMAAAGVAQLMERLADPGKPRELRIVPGHIQEGGSVRTVTG